MTEDAAGIVLLCQLVRPAGACLVTDRPHTVVRIGNKTYRIRALMRRFLRLARRPFTPCNRRNCVHPQHGKRRVRA